jgi:hypothetical protein
MDDFRDVLMPARLRQRAGIVVCQLDFLLRDADPGMLLKQVNERQRMPNQNDGDYRRANDGRDNICSCSHYRGRVQLRPSVEPTSIEASFEPEQKTIKLKTKEKLKKKEKRKS